MSEERTLEEQCYGECWAAKERIQELEVDIEALTATRDRQAGMLRRLEDREAELDAEIGTLREELALAERLASGRLAMVEQLAAEVEALRRDAELGRWLRDWLESNGLLIRAIRGESLSGYEHPENKALRRDAERLRDELRHASIDSTRAEVERLREALKVCLSHWFKGDNPDELQVNVARFKELCDWDAALRQEET